MKINIATLFLAAFALLVLFRFGWGLPWTATRIAGAAIAIPSFVLLCAARLQLGRAFSVRAKATVLVTAGLYARIRHPIYIFGALTVAGAILWIGHPKWLFVFAIIIPMQVYRARKEARVLEEKFGDAYREYRRKTWF